MLIQIHVAWYSELKGHLYWPKTNVTDIGYYFMNHTRSHSAHVYVLRLMCN